MRKARRVFAAFLAALCALAFPAAAFGAEALSGAVSAYERVYDGADLFSDEEERTLSEEVLALKSKTEMDVAVATTEDAMGYSSHEFASRFYNENGMGVGDDFSGVIFLIDMDNREITVSTEGKMIRFLPDTRIDAILDDAYGYASEGDYYGAAGAFIKDTEICYDNGIAASEYNYDAETGKVSRYRSIQWYEAAVAIVIAAVCGFTAVGSVVRGYGVKDSGSRMSANFQLSYRNDSAFRMGNLLADVLLGSYITHRLISAPRNNGGGGIGGGGGSFSGGGRATTHSYGGHSHGGGSRKF